MKICINKTLILAFLLLYWDSYKCVNGQNIELSKVTSGDEPFVYTPHSTTDLKKLKVDETGITVVTGNRFPTEELVFNTQIIAYSLNHDLSLNWITEDNISSGSLHDGVITNSAIYVLHGASLHTIVISKFSRNTGELLWRKVISETASSAGRMLEVNENSKTLAVTAANINTGNTQIWWYQTDGTFQNQWQDDSQKSEGEQIHDLRLLDNNNAIVVSRVNVDLGSIRVISVGDDGIKQFDYQRLAEVFMGSKISTMQVMMNNDLFISYTEENQLGIHRLSQLGLNDEGSELFLKKHADLVMVGGEDQLLPELEQVLTVAEDDSIPGSGQLKILRTGVDGIVLDEFDYSYSGKGHNLGVRKIKTNPHHQVMIIGTINNPFPDHFTDTLYLRFNENNELCNEIQVDGSDFHSQLQFFNQNFYELLYIKEQNTNNQQLHVVKHPNINACNGNHIFASGFE